jgi:hypothetical protein
MVKMEKYSQPPGKYSGRQKAIFPDRKNSSNQTVLHSMRNKQKGF